MVVAIFEYIELLKHHGIKKYIFDELKVLTEMDFKYSEKCPPSQYTSFLAQQMQENFPAQWTLCGNAVLRKFDPVLIREHIELLRPDNFRLVLASQEFPSGVELKKVEKWYSTEYDIMDLSRKLVSVNISIESLMLYIKHE